MSGSAAETITFGCRLNIVESEALAGEARGAGEENLVIVNTCAVTAESTRQARQAIRRLHRERPDARIIVTGCAATIAPAEFSAMEGVTRVVGNGDKSLFAPAGFSFAAPKALGASEGTRGFLAVQNGCDHRCTFCVIPFGRGPSRSVPPREIVARARELVASGKREIVLTGVDLTSYGGDLGGGETLGRLARLLLAELPELARLRISSIDCIEADPTLIEAVAEEPRLAPHLHLSLQSGDDLILKRMKRRHSRRDAIKFCEELRLSRPDIVFGADFIVGFPTETEEMFSRRSAWSSSLPALNRTLTVRQSSVSDDPTTRLPLQWVYCLIHEMVVERSNRVGTCLRKRENPRGAPCIFEKTRQRWCVHGWPSLRKAPLRRSGQTATNAREKLASFDVTSPQHGKDARRLATKRSAGVAFPGSS